MLLTRRRAAPARVERAGQASWGLVLILMGWWLLSKLVRRRRLLRLLLDV